MNPELLGTTGVIATILSVIFALAAYWNSRQRALHHDRLEKERKPQESLHFRPPPATPLATTPPAKPSLRQTARDPAPSPDKPLLFRQIRPTGEFESDDTDEQDDLYVWE